MGEGFEGGQGGLVGGVGGGLVWGQIGLSWWRGVTGRQLNGWETTSTTLLLISKLLCKPFRCCAAQSLKEGQPSGIYRNFTLSLNLGIGYREDMRSIFCEVLHSAIMHLVQCIDQLCLNYVR